MNSLKQISSYLKCLLLGTLGLRSMEKISEKTAPIIATVASTIFFSKETKAQVQIFNHAKGTGSSQFDCPWISKNFGATTGFPAPPAGTIAYFLGVDSTVNRSSVVTISSFNNASINGPGLKFLRSRGWYNMQMPVDSADIIGGISGSGYGSTHYKASPQSIIVFRAAQNWTDNNNGSNIEMFTTPKNDSIPLKRISIKDDGTFQLLASKYTSVGFLRTDGSGNSTTATLTGSEVSTALGYTPASSTDLSSYLQKNDSTNNTGYVRNYQLNSLSGVYYPLSSNPAGYLTGITSSQITTALGFTPYSAANPSGYITSSALSPYKLINDTTGNIGYTPLWRTYKVKDSVVNLLSSYLTTSSASATYLTIANAASTYQPIGTYATASNSMAFTNKSGNVSMWTNDAGYLTTASISGKLNVSDSVGNTGYAQLWRLNKVKDSLQTNIAAKFTTPSGTTAQYVRGDGTLATFPTTVTHAPAYSTRSLNTAFQASTTNDMMVSYTVDIGCTITITGGQTGTVTLEYADDNSISTNVKTVQTAINQNTGTVVVGVSMTQTATASLTGTVPSGKWVRIRTTNTTGSPSFTYRNAQETPF